jgi:hypothetical protein
MEIESEGTYFIIKNTRGPVPKELSGLWSSKHLAAQAVEMFQKKVQSRAINVTQRNKERRQRASENSATAS